PLPGESIRRARRRHREAVRPGSDVDRHVWQRDTRRRSGVSSRIRELLPDDVDRRRRAMKSTTRFRLLAGVFLGLIPVPVIAVPAAAQWVSLHEQTQLTASHNW